jgi:hypothetical protein
MTEHNSWILGDKATQLITTLNEPAAHILHSVPTEAKYEEGAAVLKNRYVAHHLVQHSILS